MQKNPPLFLSSADYKSIMSPSSFLSSAWRADPPPAPNPPTHPPLVFLSAITSRRRTALSFKVHMDHVCTSELYSRSPSSPFPQCWGRGLAGATELAPYPRASVQKHRHRCSETRQTVMETAHFPDTWGGQKASPPTRWRAEWREKKRKGKKRKRWTNPPPQNPVPSRSSGKPNISPFRK